MTSGTLQQRLGRARERLASVQARAGQALGNRIAVRRRVLDGTSKLLMSLSYQSVLARGYALVRDADGLMVRQAQPLHPGVEVSIQFSDGQLVAEIKGGSSSVTADPGMKRARPRSSSGPSGRGGQGSLF